MYQSATLQQVIATDNVFKFADNQYGTQCTQWAKKFTLAELIKYYAREYQVRIKN